MVYVSHGWHLIEKDLWDKREKAIRSLDERSNYIVLLSCVLLPASPLIFNLWTKVKLCSKMDWNNLD